MAAKGMDSIYISVGNMAESLAFYRDWIGMEIVADEQLIPAEVSALWNLSQVTAARQVSLKSKQQSTLLKLIEFSPNTGKTIQENAKPWDYRIYCLSFLVKDIDVVHRGMTAQGFTAISAPVQYQVDGIVPYGVKETIILGPDKVPIDHFQRMSNDKYEDAGNYVKFAYSGQRVKSVDEAQRFYVDILGLDLLFARAASQGLADAMLGLPPDSEVKATVCGRRGENSLNVEFLEFTIKGKPLVARPPDLGLFMISFEVDNLSAFIEKLKKARIKILSGPVKLHTKGCGEISAITVEGPDQTLVELFER